MPIKKRDQLRAALAQDLSENAVKYRYAIMREVSLILRDYKSADIRENLDEIVNMVQQRFDIPASARNLIVESLQNYQDGIATMWDDYFDEAGVDVSMSPEDLDRMMALYQVDFAKIKADTRDVIVEELRRSARASLGYEELRNRLMKRGLGAGAANTLANTGLAQFDNAYMQEISRRAGLDSFLYDGVLHPTSRPFCKKHWGKVYTIDEIMKLDNGQGLPVLTSCGGYNCVHYWTPDLP